MTIQYNPSALLRRVAPKTKLKRLVTMDLNVNRAVLAMFTEIDFIKKRDLLTVALKTVKQYKKRYSDERANGKSIVDSKADTINDKKLLIHRVQNAVVHQVAQEIKEEYQGERYKWLPSDAETPDPQHQLNYGKVFFVGEGEMPGDRYGCRCSMEILVKDEKLKL